jgi:hypothetical protein
MDVGILETRAGTGSPADAFCGDIGGGKFVVKGSDEKI